MEAARGCGTTLVEFKFLPEVWQRLDRFTAELGLARLLGCTALLQGSLLLMGSTAVQFPTGIMSYRNAMWDCIHTELVSTILDIQLRSWDKKYIKIDLCENEHMCSCTMCSRPF